MTNPTNGNDLHGSALKLLAELATIPSAPFHEFEVMEFVQRWAKDRGMAVERDPWGNMRVELEGPGGSARKNKAEPLLVLSAHMDHPGLEIVENSAEGPVVARPLGGIPIALCRGAVVRCFPPRTSAGADDGGGVLFRVASVRESGDGPESTAGEAGKTEAPPKPSLHLAPLVQGEPSDRPAQGVDRTPGPGWWGVWEFDGLVQEGEKLVMRAADDLAGCAIILATLERLQQLGHKAPPVVALLTRAEEVGLRGAVAAAADGRLLPESGAVLVVETSRAVNGARMGEGPVVRVGDRRSVFGGEPTLFLEGVAAELSKRDQDFSFQRALLDGGTCEGTIFQSFGRQVAAISIPLDNYHNADHEGETIAPEAVHRRDFLGTASLVLGASLSFLQEGGDWGARKEKRATELLQKSNADMERLEKTSPFLT